MFLLPLKAGGTGLNLTRATRLIAEGTLEDQVAALLENKSEFADAVIGSGDGWIAELPDARGAGLSRW